jgi:hypothetical protein
MTESESNGLTAAKAWNETMTMDELMFIMDTKTLEIEALKRERTILIETKREQIEGLVKERDFLTARIADIETWHAQEMEEVRDLIRELKSELKDARGNDRY